jgi:hypothetical protein
MDSPQAAFCNEKVDQLKVVMDSNDWFLDVSRLLEMRHRCA